MTRAGDVSAAANDCLPVSAGRFEPVKGEKVHETHTSQVLRLTLLAPDLVEEILDGQESESMKLPLLLQGVPVEW